MKKLDRFLLKSFIGPFIAILFIVIFILMMQFLWLYIDELVGKGLGLLTVIEFMFWGICSTALPLALPLATLLAGIMTIGSMAENNEYMAIKAAGVSFGRMIRSLIITSFIISIGAFFVLNNLVPKAYNEIYTLRDDISKTKETIKIPSGTFYDGIEGYILRTEDQTEGGTLVGVMVYDHTGNKGNTALTLADSATIKMSKTKDYLDFTLYNGTNYQETNVKKYKDTTLQLNQINFEQQKLIIPLANYSFEKSDSTRFGDQSKAMNYGQLKRGHDSLTLVMSDKIGAIYRRYNNALPLVAKTQLDTSRKGGAQTLFHSEDYLRWENPLGEINAYRNAAAHISRVADEVRMSGTEIYEPEFYLRHADLEIWKKFAQALACFILFFIGAPLGALIKKGGLGTGMIISVLFFVLYWVVDISGTKLAGDGSIPTFSGAFISSFVLGPIGVFFTWKAIHDSDILSKLDNFKIWRHKVWSHILRIFKPVRIVFMGTPEFAVASLDRLVSNKFNVVGVVTVADKPSGRGLKLNESAVKQYATAHGIPVLQPVRLKDPEFLESLRAFKADMFVVVAFRMLPEEVWKMPRMGTFNLHAALLPQYRGAAPINWAVINGERVTGVTTFMLDKDIDTGAIIYRQDTLIGPEETAGEVHDRLMEIGADLVVQTVEALVQKNVEVRVQRSFIQGQEELKPAPKLTRELCNINWNDTTTRIYNLIRGLSPCPTAFTELVKIGDAESSPVQLKIFKAEKMTASAEPGTILSDGKSYLAIATSDGAISIKDLQIQGKKRMNVEDFLRGFRSITDYSCRKG